MLSSTLLILTGLPCLVPLSICGCLVGEKNCPWVASLFTEPLNPATLYRTPRAREATHSSSRFQATGCHWRTSDWRWGRDCESTASSPSGCTGKCTWPSVKADGGI
ncbi:uncharacterized protein BDZ83DRAFT_316619 [Colletotrichum acutatum]|uniref:Secreted protein n=1 Tax=Glomerella acutata TaxID=27357 RepID=A0AAD8UKN5_GLOAC|nr:uncharacterized protein BDZ83DRAFT_316619 [Colletotrichum acutatum]KAK1725043.1 hypothetical protein BDZ83DRAFT_316619 [Colletotrichum acutatum]